VIAARTFSDIVPRTPRVRIRLELPHQLSGPLRRHAVVGTAVVVAGARTIARIPLLLARTLPAVSSLTVAAHLIARPFTLVPLALLLAAVVAFTLRRRTRGRDSAGPEPA
jgi:hypothetical protein